MEEKFCKRYENWLEMLRLRNTLSRDYDGQVIAQACDKIINSYIEGFDNFLTVASNIIKSESISG